MCVYCIRIYVYASIQMDRKIERSNGTIAMWGKRGRATLGKEVLARPYASPPSILCCMCLPGGCSRPSPPHGISALHCLGRVSPIQVQQGQSRASEARFFAHCAED